MTNVVRKLKPYLKSLVAGGAAVTYALQAALSDDVVTNAEWVSIGTLVLVTAGVFTVPNKPAA